MNNFFLIASSRKAHPHPKTKLDASVPCVLLQPLSQCCTRIVCYLVSPIDQTVSFLRTVTYLFISACPTSYPVFTR